MGANGSAVFVAYTDDFVVINAKARFIADRSDLLLVVPPYPDLLTSLQQHGYRYEPLRERRQIGDYRRQALRRLCDLGLIRRMRRLGFARAYVWTRHGGFRAAPFMLFAWLLGARRCFTFWDGKHPLEITGSWRLLNSFRHLVLAKGRWQWLLSYLARRLGSSRSWGMPTTLEIEPASICNLRCPMCKTGVRDLRRPAGLMRLDDFRAIIRQVGWHTNRLLLYGTGEPFIHPEIYEMIRVAREAKIAVSLCTNGDLVDGPRLAQAQPEEVYFAIDGADPETHAVYRRGSDLNRVIENIRHTLQERRRLGNVLPEVVMSVIVMKQNEHQLGALRRLAIELGVDRLQFTQCTVWDLRQARAFLPADPAYVKYEREALAKGRIRQTTLGRSMCEVIWHYAIITSTGDIAPCCGVELPIPQPDGTLSFDHDERFYPMGSALEAGGVRRAWNSPKFRALRRSILNKRYEGHCTICSGYRAPELIPAAWGGNGAGLLPDTATADVSQRGALDATPAPAEVVAS